MQKIRLLSDFEIGCIAAGEVIENPSSIIKELVENAIDAKATEIKIYFKQGGVEEIIIIDNGHGMSRDDLALALIPHATSKLFNIDDLYSKNNIFFGFRGEALSAIAGVSEVTIISREIDVQCGYSISADHGKLFDIEQMASNFGTTVIVKNLFEKIPARKKYLSSMKNQEKNILYIITGLVLSHPQVNFFIYKDSKLYQEYKAADDFLTRSYQLISQDKEKYLPILYEDMYMKLEGLVSVYEYGHYDRSKIFILANNRLIKQYKITQSCIKAYNGENFAKKYPELFLSITVSPDQIDVNVHPRKEEVLFLYQKKIEQLLTEVLVKVLEERTKKIFSEKINYSFDQDEKIQAAFSKSNIHEASKKSDLNSPIDLPRVYNTMQQNNEIFKKPIDSIEIQKTIDYPEKNTIDNVRPQLLESLPVQLDNNIFHNELIYGIQPLLFEEKKTKQYVGILGNTYILFLENDGILFIDQHALHEKILYEEYINQVKEKKIIMQQQLLFQEKMSINSDQKELLINNKELFNFVGIDYDIHHDLVIIKSFPVNLLKFNITHLFSDYLVLLEQNKEKNMSQKHNILLHEMAALYGCKNAIKAGDKLDLKEIEFLVQSVDNMNNGTYCPHGRPIYYQMKLNELHNLFKRT